MNQISARNAGLTARNPFMIGFGSVIFRCFMELERQPFLFLDAQTTGLSSRTAEILELGWSLSFQESFIQTRVSKPRQLESVPKKVWRMTGLQPADLEVGSDLCATWRGVCQSTQAFAPPGCTAVIHYSQFETPFLCKLHESIFGEGTPLPWKIICTYRVAKRLYGDLPARSLRAVSGHLGFPLPETHRARDHVAATQRIWRHLLGELKTRESITTFEDFENFMNCRAASTKKGARRYLVDRQQRLDLPLGPGVYEMVSKTGGILYIGKATSLRDRVNSYFRQRRTTRSRLKELMAQAAEIRVVATETPLEAALLENDRIKACEPPYNDSLRSRGRRLGFVSRSLDEFAEAPDAVHPWGPFISRESFESLDCLRQLEQGELPEEEAALLGHPPEELKSALEEFLKGLGVSDLSTLSSLDLLRAARRVPQASKDTDVGNEVVASLHRKLRRPLHRWHQSRWLCWLMECRILWRVSDTGEKPWRSLWLREGKVVRAESVAAQSLKETFWRERVSSHVRQKNFDLVTYDRLRVLFTELSILAKRGVQLRIQFSSTRVYDTQGSSGWFSRILSSVREGLL